MFVSLRSKIPEEIKIYKRRYEEYITQLMLQFFALNRWTAAIFYFLFCRDFDREHLSVLNGRVRYFKTLKQIGDTSPLLRRNIHRIEKGLIMRPRRAVFAADYISETISIFEKASRKSSYSPAEKKWATDVLMEYFSVVDDTPQIANARVTFEKIISSSKPANFDANSDYSPYKLIESPETSVTFDELEILYQKRRSVRWYKQEAISEKLIQQAISAAATAPSACNRQPYRFIVANNNNDASCIAECAGGTIGFSDQLPSVIVVVGDLSAYPHNRDRHLIYIDSALASMQLMLAASTLGLSTCPINWPDIPESETKLRNVIEIEDFECVIMLIAIGFGDEDGGIPFSQKKQNEMIIDEAKLKQ